LKVWKEFSLRYVSHLSELKNPDMIILPGTKNTMEDLLWMRQSGMEGAVLKAAAAGKVIFGVCGGYQMLGETLSDPLHVEAGGTIKGMGLLPWILCLRKRKPEPAYGGKFQQVSGVLEGLSGVELEGYEIHMGASRLKEGVCALTEIENYAGEAEKKPDGAYRENIYGTYVHGVLTKKQWPKA
jgi:adenosylcobyric acid synthase